MGDRRRRFTVLDDNDNKAPHADPSVNVGSPSQAPDLKEMDGDWKEVVPPESSKGRAAKPVTVESQPQQQPLVATAAVPIGDPVSVAGKRGKKQRRHYKSLRHNGRTYNLEDTVLVTPEHSDQKPYPAIIKDIIEAEGELFITSQWLYRPEEVKIEEGNFCIARDTRELFYSTHVDDVPVESIMHKCVVHFIVSNKQFPPRKKYPGFIVQMAYDPVEKKLWDLTDKRYEGQQEIEILLNKTKDRIGDLPNIEPEDAPSDTTSQISKQSLTSNGANHVHIIGEPPAATMENTEMAETPANDAKLENYAILARYKALTGNEHRDIWLGKLLESIPLAWSKEISARVLEAGANTTATKSLSCSSSKNVASDGNEKSYEINDVVPVIVSIERSAYEALGTDFKKYNQKMRRIWYYIKDSSKLRIRLMNKKLDPPALLTMSPNELKVGSISAVKASEPEHPRQMQMTDARCQRCHDKKVGICDIIQAGYRARYQLECSSCGHIWFSSNNAVLRLMVDGPSTAVATGSTTAVGTSTAGQPTSCDPQEEAVPEEPRQVS